MRAQDLSAQGRVAEAIRCVRGASGLDVLQAKAIVDGMRGGTGGAGLSLVARVRELAAAGHQEEAVRLLCADAGMSIAQASALVTAVRGRR